MKPEKEKNLSTEAELPKDSKKITINVKLLQRIAEFYEFPFAVFLVPDNYKFKGKTRKDARLRKIIEFEQKIREMFEDYFGDFK